MQHSHDAQTNQGATPAPGQDAMGASSPPPAGAAHESSGMLGAKGTAPRDVVAGTTAPVGVPTEPGGDQSPGTGVIPQAISGAATPGTPLPGPLAQDPTPPALPNGVRSGAAGAQAIARPAGERDSTAGDTTDSVSGNTSGGIGATEDEVNRSPDTVTPDVTDMGLDEKNRDRPDVPGYGRGGTPAYGGARARRGASGALSSWGCGPDAPHIVCDGAACGGAALEMPAYGRTAQPGLGGGRPSRPDAENLPDDEDRAAGGRPTPHGTLSSAQALGASPDSGPNGPGARADDGAGMLNQHVPEGMVGVGPLGGVPARADTADAQVLRNKHGITAPSSAGSRNIHLGIGANSPTGESTPQAQARIRSEQETHASGAETADAEAAIHAVESDVGVPLAGSLRQPTPEVGVAGATGPAEAAATGERAQAKTPSTPNPTYPTTAQGYPISPTATGLPAGSGSGGPPLAADPAVEPTRDEEAPNR